MAISAVNGVNLDSHRKMVSFGHNGEAETAPQQGPKRASNFVKIPVVMLMTLSPSLLNSATAAAEDYSDDFNFPQTEQLYAMAAPAPQSSRTSSTSQRPSSVRPEVVQYQKTFTSDGTQYTMYYVHKSKPKSPGTKYVSEVYFVPKGYKAINYSGGKVDDNDPPKLKGIIFHDLGEGKEFVGAKVVETKCGKYGYQHEKTWHTKEIRLPEDIAMGLMDLVKGRTQFKVPEMGELDRMFGGANMEVSKSSSLMREQVR